MDYLGYIGVQLRPYETLMYILVSSAILLNIFAVLIAHRFVPETSSAFYIGIFLCTICIISIMVFLYCSMSQAFF